MGDEHDPDSERMAVLRLLEAGKITATEATDLLRALRDPERHGPSHGPAHGGPGPQREWVEAAAQRAADRAQRAADRGRRAAEYWAQHADEIAGRAAEQATRAAEHIGDHVGRIFSNLPDFMERAARSGWGTWGPGFRFEDVAEGELDPGEGPAGLELEGWNGGVTLRPIDGHRARIVLRKTVHAPTEDEARQIAGCVTATCVGRTVTVRRAPDASNWPGGLAIEAFLPRGLVWGGIVRTGNGPVDCSGLQLRGLRLETSNARVRIADCSGEDCTVATSNGRIEAEGLRGQLELRTSNGGVAIRPASGPGESAIVVTTSNGPIEVRVPTGAGLEIDASTSNGRFDVSGLGPDGPAVEGNRGFGRSDLAWKRAASGPDAGHVRLALRTTNGPIRFA